MPGPQNGRYAAEPLTGLTSLTDFESGRRQYNASVQAAVDLGETLKRIDGSEVPLRAPWQGKAAPATPATGVATEPTPGQNRPADRTGATVQEAVATSTGKPVATDLTRDNAPAEPLALARPAVLDAPRGGKADNLKMVWGIGPKIERLLHRLGVFHFDQLVNLTEEELHWIDANLENFKGRASRDRWKVQARVLIDGGTEQDAEAAMRHDVGPA